MLARDWRSIPLHSRLPILFLFFWSVFCVTRSQLARNIDQCEKSSDPARIVGSTDVIGKIVQLHHNFRFAVTRERQPRDRE
jgi:hypothetical protein